MKLPLIDIKRTGERIDSLRKKNGVSILEIAIRCGITKTAVYKWVYGKCLPSVDNLVVLSYLFGVTIEDILVKYEVEVTE